MSTDIAICNTGLILVGADQITSFQDDTREAEICSAIYETTRDFLLQSIPWRFSLRQEELAKVVGAPKFGYSFVYQLPPDMLRLISISNSSNQYKIYEDKLHSSDNTVEVVYQYNPGESEFPSYFKRYLEYDLAEIFSGSLSKDMEQVQVMNRLKEQAGKRARLIDSQNQPPRTIDDSVFELTSVR